MSATALLDADSQSRDVSGKKDLRDLERAYRAERAEILEDPGLSWEAKMRKIRELFERYRQRRDELDARAKGA